MNRHRRARLQEANSLLSKALEIVDDAREEEQENVDNCPENLQHSDRYYAMEDAVIFVLSPIHFYTVLLEFSVYFASLNKYIP